VYTDCTEENATYMCMPPEFMHITTIHRSHTHRCDLAHTPRLRLSAPAQEPGAAPDPKGSFMPEGWRWMLTPLTG